ncbi:YozE family protein [Psychrobacillus sp. INOP01]|uniref:YozE family protein n=1 Tax=Psychrobacillus sp. INOP01 TaxID=2829187 RepID=UPI001BA60B87|nr:YozE family protein [Psychrobacillus sp. INOP01]QUG41584.1 YozE family protein [Psychrobacillus sp. INOP01]
MRQSFYLFALKFRGGQKEDEKSKFANSMFDHHDFPKAETSFDIISLYIEELADPNMPATVFDKIWEYYIEDSK